MSLLPQVTGKAGIVVRGQRTVQVGKLNSKSAAARQWEAPGGFLGWTVRFVKVSPRFSESIGPGQSAKKDRGSLRKQSCQLEETRKTE